MHFINTYVVIISSTYVTAVKPHIKTHEEKGVPTRPNQMRKQCAWTYDNFLWTPFFIRWCQSIIIGRTKMNIK